MYRFVLPDLGEGIAEAELVEWLVEEGKSVQEDQIIAKVMTDKALVEIPSPRTGRVHRLVVDEGAIASVGAVLIEIDDADADVAPGGTRDADVKGPLQEAVKAKEAPPKPEAENPPPTGSRGTTNHPPHMPPRPQAHLPIPSRGREKRADAVPAVRELAKQLNIDIEQVPGTGPDGRVMRRDVEAFQKAAERSVAPPTHPPVSELAQEDEPDWERQLLRGVRRSIADRVMRSKTLIPHYTYVEEVDVTSLESVRRNLPTDSAPSPLAFIARAALTVLPDYPQLNACVDEQTGEIIFKAAIHLGIAVATEEGLMVPVIRNAGKLDVANLAIKVRELSEKARKKKLNLSELRGSTFTITSLGKLGGVMATPIINYPASAIMGVHAIRTLPRYVDGSVQPREIMNLSLSLDHRIVDGFEGAQFIQDVREILQRADFEEFQKGD